MKYKCIIVDDEAHAIEGLERYIATIPELEVLKTYSDSLVALKEIPKLPLVDVIFLDVDMQMINGIELAKEIRGRTKKLVFTTGHRAHAYEAFEVQADAYLLKPYSVGKFVITINKLFPESGFEDSDTLAVNVETGSDYFYIKTKVETTKMVKIHFNDVVFVESKGHNLYISTLKKSYTTTYMSLSEMLKTLSMHRQFMQPHRSYIVNENHIDSITGNRIKMINGDEVAIGEQYRKGWNEYILLKAIKGTKK